LIRSKCCKGRLRLHIGSRAFCLSVLEVVRLRDQIKAHEEAGLLDVRVLIKNMTAIIAKAAKATGRYHFVQIERDPVTIIRAKKGELNEP
jgi:hypothetical protein